MRDVTTVVRGGKYLYIFEKILLLKKGSFEVTNCSIAILYKKKDLCVQLAVVQEEVRLVQSEVYKWRHCNAVQQRVIVYKCLQYTNII